MPKSCIIKFITKSNFTKPRVCLSLVKLTRRSDSIRDKSLVWVQAIKSSVLRGVYLYSSDLQWSEIEILEPTEVEKVLFSCLSKKEVLEIFKNLE